MLPRFERKKGRRILFPAEKGRGKKGVGDYVILFAGRKRKGKDT